MTGHVLGNYSTAQVDRELDLIAGAGASWVRVDVPWRFIEPAEGDIVPDTLNRLDYIIAAAGRRGVRVQAVVIEYPDWCNRSQGMWVPPDDDTDFENIMRFLSARYAGRIDYWELGNEVNETEFWAVPRSDSPRRYAHFLQYGYRGVKAGNPSAKVISAGLAGSDHLYLQEMYDAGAKGYFDLLGVHAYTHGRSPYAIDPKEPSSTFAGLAAMKATMERNGDVGKKIWITEVGWQTSNVEYHVTQQQQAQFVYEAYQRLVNEFPYVEELFIYGARNSGTNAGLSTFNYGLLNQDYSPKLAYAAYKRAHEDFDKLPTPLSIRASRSSIKRGKSLIMGGTAKGVPGASVRLQIKVRTRWKTIRTVRSNAAGTYLARIRLTSRGTRQYRAVFAGNAGRRAAVSRTIRVRVR
jgi:hypothetical protein